MSSPHRSDRDVHEHHMHHHGHAHDHGPQQFNLAFLLAVVLNLSFTIIEAGYAISANSMSLLADAGHNLGDVLGLVLAWIATFLLQKSASERYSYGFKKTTIIASLINALILVSTAAIIAYESIYKLYHPAQVNEPIIIVVALIGIFVNGGTALMFMRGRHDDMNIKAAFLHLAYDALISLGVVVGGLLILATGWIRLDPLIGLMIVFLIIMGTYGLLRDSINSILDAVPRQVNQQGVREYLCNIEGVIAVHDLHIWGLSTKEIALTAHLVMPDRNLSDADHQVINAGLLEKFKINHVTIQVEQGTTDDPCGQVKTC